MSMKNKLARMKQHLAIKEQPKQLELNERHKEEKPLSEVPFEKEWGQFQAKPFWFDDSYTLIREKEYSLNHKHGRYFFSELQSIIDRWQEHKVNHPLSAKGRSVGDLLFFDTETTGLSSGAGNTIFMLGFCQIKNESVQVKQYFLPGPESEVALYHHFLTDVGSLGNLVTYNGKAFDWPQVKTRHTFVRDQVPKLPSFGHFDLLHASRRLWKNVLPTCKLSVVEKEILQFERIEDTPSHMAPMLYFDFLQEQDPEFVKGIFQHHEWDVLSLMTLYTHLSNLILECETNVFLPREQYEIARWYEAIGEKEIAYRLYEQIMGIGSFEQEASLYQYSLGMKQIGGIETALNGFLKLVGTQSWTYHAAIETSKIYEHQLKDYDKALYYTDKALSDEKFFSSQTKSKQIKLLTELDKRKTRLQKKSN
ncbi:ribonuclease H-like domain-containing protein [Halalkalibacter akibai]|uniref:Exonuclease n=1 Tax=Halalkalibacter akibai (strain ATCC 43226 / DSM 21942 / CIP 109018 / JCM 9157 / 1139) TaxID=1236973 RepID=W4QZ36_HALA3|nr:ribonuclease H-like domain-containing protein [Halalkalibacter akibai]GAE36913.1 exonuclease [Halalkalibacter akibai JCM 9157]